MEKENDKENVGLVIDVGNKVSIVSTRRKPRDRRKNYKQLLRDNFKQWTELSACNE